MVYTKKAISPVVATALLLVVAVVAVVGFQSWFTTYQSGVNTKVEQNSASGSSILVDRLEVDGTMYIKNRGVDPVDLLNSTKIVDADGIEVAACGSAVDLDTSIAAAEDVTPVGFGVDCGLYKGAKYDVVVVTNDGVFTSTQLAR